MNTEIEVVTSGGRTASLQVVQDIYNSVTGKTETVSRLFFDAHIVNFSDLENLHHCIEQSMEQYDCKVSNCLVSVRTCDGKSDNFSSFSRFKSTGLNRSRSTVEVELQYDFLILLPKTSEAKPYKLVVGLRSGIGVIDSFQYTNATETEQSMYFALQSGTARLEIHYVDLSVARSLEAVVEDWYRGLTKISGNVVLMTVREWRRALPSVLRAGVLSSSLFVCFLLLKDTTQYISDLFRSLILTFGVVGISLSFSVPISNYISKITDRSRPSSVVMISKVDEELFERSKKSSTKAVTKAIFSAAGAILIGLITAYLGAKIGFP